MEKNTNPSLETKALDLLTEMLEYNKRFVAEKQYEQYQTSKYPDKKLATVTCMDTRLVKLLPAALGIKNGDVKIIKIARAAGMPMPKLEMLEDGIRNKTIFCVGEIRRFFDQYQTIFVR